MYLHNKVPHNNHQDYSIDYITGLFFTSLPGCIKKLLSFRNFIVKFFGLQGGDINKLKVHQVYKVYKEKYDKYQLASAGN